LRRLGDLHAVTVQRERCAVHHEGEVSPHPNRYGIGVLDVVVADAVADEAANLAAVLPDGVRRSQGAAGAVLVHQSISAGIVNGF
jgi:hypothetical protein